MAKTGQVAVFVAVGKPLEIRKYPVVPPASGQVLLKLRRSAICGTDLHIVEGRLPVPGPFIPGHEFVGEVVQIGGRRKTDGLGSPLAVGDLVIACVALPCGKCFSCRRGETASCLAFGVTYVKDPAQSPHFFGGYAEYLHQPIQTCVKIPAGVALDAAAALPCAGPTSIRAFTYAGGLKRGELVAVQGTGPVGLFAIAWAAKAGCEVVAIGSTANPARVKLAKALGAKTYLDYRKNDVDARATQLKQLAEKLHRGDGADVVFEASGAPTSFADGLKLLRTRGRFIVPGQYSASGAVSISPEMITFRALTIVGSGQYTMADIGTYLDFLKRHKALQSAIAGCITHRYLVSEANKACCTCHDGGAVKAVFAAD